MVVVNVWIIWLVLGVVILMVSLQLLIFCCIVGSSMVCVFFCIVMLVVVLWLSWVLFESCVIFRFLWILFFDSMFMQCDCFSVIWMVCCIELLKIGLLVRLLILLSIIQLCLVNVIVGFGCSSSQLFSIIIVSIKFFVVSISGCCYNGRLWWVLVLVFGMCSGVELILFILIIFCIIGMFLKCQCLCDFYNRCVLCFFNVLVVWWVSDLVIVDNRIWLGWVSIIRCVVIGLVRFFIFIDLVLVWIVLVLFFQVSMLFICRLVCVCSLIVCCWFSVCSLCWQFRVKFRVLMVCLNSMNRLFE